MTRAATLGLFSFRLGDDVVARLDGAPYNLDEDALVEGESRPSWAVATIAGREWRDHHPYYLLTFQLDEDRCLCFAAEAAIEGLA